MAKKILIMAATVIGLSVLSGGIWFGTKIWQSLTAPKLTLEQNLTEDGSFMESILSSGDLRYVSTAVEYSLTPTKPFLLGRQIGNLMGDLHLYTIPGNEDYAVLTGFMFPADVFRKESAAAIDFSRLQIDKIQFFGSNVDEVDRRNTRDPGLMDEVSGRLDQSPSLIAEKTNNSGTIRLFSKDLPGLYFYLYIQEASDKTIYFMFPAYQDWVIEAGPLFTEWIADT